MSKIPLLVGVTGGIGSGKSVICKIFSILGTPVYDADSRAKYLMQNDVELKSEIKKEFGGETYNESGILNSKFLANQVFSNETRLKKLNKLVHPVVRIDFEKWANSQKGAEYIIEEAALLFETGSYKNLDSVILVTAPENLRITRVLERDKNRTENDVRQIINRQWAEERKMKLADIIIKNDGIKPVLPEVLNIHKKFKEKKLSRK